MAKKASVPAWDVEMWPVDQPKDWPGNPRKITDTAVDKMAKIIGEFGFRQPLVVDEDGVIIVGHLRRRGARKLGHTHVPVHVARGLTDAQRRAYRLADNRAGEEVEWDDGALVIELRELEGMDFDLDLTGFDVAELEKILDPMAGVSGSVETFGEVDPENLETEYCCPKCGYEWSGKPK